MFHKSAGPAHLHSVNVCGSSETEVYPYIVLGDVTRTAAHFVDQSSLSSFDGDLGTYPVTVGAGSDRFECDPLISRTRPIYQKAWFLVNIIDDDGKLAIVPKIAYGQSSRGRRGVNPGSRRRRDVGEGGIAVVAIKEAWLLVSATQVKLVHFRIDVSVSKNEVWPAVVVEVEEHGAPAQVLRMQAEPSRESNIRKKSFTIVAVEGGGVIGEVGLKNIRPAVAVVIGDGCTHSGLLAAIFVERNPGRYRNVGECAIVIVAIKDAWGAVACNVDIGPTIIVKIEGGNTHPVMSIGLADVSLGGDIRESAVSAILIQDILRTRQTARPAHYRNALPHARASLAGDWSGG